MKAFYHSADLDGHCSGAIIKYVFPKCKLIPINYGDVFPWETIEQGERVFMVDFSLQPFEDMEKLNKISDFVWIDHHKTAINEAHKRHFLASNTQVLDIGRAACELVWEYFFPNIENETVRLLGRYDVWDLIPGTLELQNGLRMHNTSPENIDLWSKLFESSYSKLLQESLDVGKILLKKQRNDNIAYAEACAFETEMDGLKVIAINRGLTNSQIFDSVYDPNIHDAMLTFVWRGKQWTISLYSDKSEIDVGAICKIHGGGGHHGAAGFQSLVLPFDLH